MKNTKLALVTLTVLVALLLIHRHGMSGHLYLNYWFYDIIAHFLAGVGIALSVYYISKDQSFILPLTIIAGILWEIFEIYFDLTGWPVSSTRYLLDTSKDLVVDIVGALVVLFIIKRSK